MTKLIGTNNNQVPSNGDLGTAAFMDKSEFVSAKSPLIGKIKRKIKKSSDVTDVFVYDTRLDSDGGAWRKTTTSTSWYNEALNTQTRGSRREFPQVAIIVTEQANGEKTAITIYDADDPNLPMWMVFKNKNTNGGSDQTSTNDYFAAGPYNSQCVTAINGEMFDGQNRSSGHITGIVKGITRFNFINDSSTMYADEGEFLREGNLGDQRNVEHRYKKIGNSSYQTVPRSQIFDIASKIHPNAPINDKTGLPNPTIVAACDGGLMIYRNNNSWHEKSGSTYYWVDFHRDDQYLAMNTGDALSAFTIYDAESAINYTKGLRRYNGNPATYYYPFLPGNGGQVVSTDYGFAYQGSNVPLALYSEPDSNVGNLGRNSMQARVTSKYNTGWMYGWGRLAFGNSNENQGLITEESTQIVENHDLSSNSGWYLDQVTISGGALVFSGAGTAFCADDASNSKSVIGKRYVIEYDITSSSGGNLTISFSTGGSQTPATSAVGSYRFSGTVSGNTRIYLRGNSFTGTVDNVKIYEALDGYSYGNKYPRVIGEMPHGPANADCELGAYGPFSQTSGLIFPYDDQLQYGSDSFTYMYWVNTENVPAYQTHFSREYHTGSAFSGGGCIEAYTETGGGYLRLYFSDDNFSSYDVWNSNRPIFAQGWVHVAIVKTQDNKVITYIDGEVDNVHQLTAAVGSLNNSLAELVIGNQHPNYSSRSGSTDTRICLFKSSYKNPSRDQIRQIYRDESKMISPGAKVTLGPIGAYGYRLAFDKQYKKLHVMNSGTSVFDKLVRVDDLPDNGGTTSISAVNGLVVSE